MALYGFFFEKTVANLTSGASPAATAEPGNVLRYTLRLQSTDVPLDDLANRVTYRPSPNARIPSFGAL